MASVRTWKIGQPREVKMEVQELDEGIRPRGTGSGDCMIFRRHGSAQDACIRALIGHMINRPFKLDDQV